MLIRIPINIKWHNFYSNALIETSCTYDAGTIWLFCPITRNAFEDLKPGNFTSRKSRGQLTSSPPEHRTRPPISPFHPHNTSILPKMRFSLIASPLSLLLVILQVIPSFGLYFYIDGVHPKCFFEELPKDTLVVGRSCKSLSLVYGR